MNNDGIWTILAFVTGFVVAQLIKFLIGVMSGEKRSAWMRSFGSAVGYLTRSGGMPSGHAASFTAATIFLGCSQGFNSVIFALAMCVTVIVIYDAVNVRYAVGEQGKILTALTKVKEISFKKKTRVVEGHTIPQVAVGMIIGTIIGVLFWLMWQGF